MPQIERLISLDEEFRRSPAHRAIIINDLPSRSEEDREYFATLIRETFTSGMISVLPQCNPLCGELKGEHLIGEVCESCGETVRQCIEDDVAPSVWFRKPQGVEQLLNPMIWIMLTAKFQASRFKIMNWLTDRSYSPTMKVPPIIDKMIEAGIQRGYNYFVQNFDEIMKWLFSQRIFKGKNKAIRYYYDMLDPGTNSDDLLEDLIARNRDKIFSDYIPVPNRSLLVIEKSALGDFVDTTTFDIQDTLNTMLSIDRDYYDRSQITIENRTGRIMSMLTEYYSTLFRKNLTPKRATLRKHVYGTRGNHGFRAVITSHPEIADHDEIFIPWGCAVTVWRDHLLNYLMRRGDGYPGMSHNDAVGFIYGHVFKYHPLLDELLKLIISSARKKGPAVLIQRNQIQVSFS